MKKYDGYEQTEAFTGDYETLEPTGYICIIVGAKVEEKDYGHLMRIAYDIVEGEHKEFYKRMFERKKENNSEAKWPGMYYQTVKSDGLGYFKGFIQAVEQSNSGYKWNWDEKKLIGKLFGGLFGEEEYLGNDNKVKTSVKCRYVKPVETIRSGDYKVPEIKRLNNTPEQTGSSYSGMEMPPDDDLPF